jgi:hypothetical protein
MKTHQHVGGTLDRGMVAVTLKATAMEDWQLTRRQFRVLRDIPMRPPAHIATAWVTVPEWMADYPHLADSVAETAAQEVIARDFPELYRSECWVELWTAYFRDLRSIESQDRFGEAKGCRVWLTEPNPR